MLLTTQYLEEAEHLADRIAILHEGRIIADGTLAELRQLLPPATVEYVEKQPTLEEIFLAIVGATHAPPDEGAQTMTTHVAARHRRAAQAVPAPHPAQPGHDHHHRHHADRHAAAVRLRLRRRDRGRRRRYVDYLLPGILLITVASGIAYTAFRLFTDVSSGIFERFQSMPIARSAVLWGHVLTSRRGEPRLARRSSCSSPLAMGFRSGAGVLAWLAVLGILVLFTLALTWLAVIPGLTAKSVDGVSGFSYPLIFLPFISSAFVPTEGMPAPVRWFAEHQPVTPIVNTIRNLYRRAAGRQRRLDRRSPGASACWSSPTRSRCAPTVAGSR